jgi:hypothetical protein
MGALTKVRYLVGYKQALYAPLIGAAPCWGFVELPDKILMGIRFLFHILSPVLLAR